MESAIQSWPINRDKSGSVQVSVDPPVITLRAVGPAVCVAEVIGATSGEGFLVCRIAQKVAGEKHEISEVVRGAHY